MSHRKFPIFHISYRLYEFIIYSRINIDIFRNINLVSPRILDTVFIHHKLTTQKNPSKSINIDSHLVIQVWHDNRHLQDYFHPGEIFYMEPIWIPRPQSQMNIFEISLDWSNDKLHSQNALSPIYLDCMGFPQCSSKNWCQLFVIYLWLSISSWERNLNNFNWLVLWLNPNQQPDGLNGCLLVWWTTMCWPVIGLYT